MDLFKIQTHLHHRSRVGKRRSTSWSRRTPCLVMVDQWRGNCMRPAAVNWTGEWVCLHRCQNPFGLVLLPCSMLVDQIHLGLFLLTEVTDLANCGTTVREIIFPAILLDSFSGSG